MGFGPSAITVTTPFIWLVAGLGSPKQLGSGTSGASRAPLPVTVWSLHMTSLVLVTSGHLEFLHEGPGSKGTCPTRVANEVKGLLQPSLIGHTSLFSRRHGKSCPGSRGGDIDPSS